MYTLTSQGAEATRSTLHYILVAPIAVKSAPECAPLFLEETVNTTCTVSASVFIAADSLQRFRYVYATLESGFAV